MAWTPLVAHAGCDQLSKNKAYQRLAQKGAEAAAAKQYDEALTHFEKAKAICSFDPGLNYNLGVALLHVGRCAEARDAFVAADEQLASGLIETSLTKDAIDKKLGETNAQCPVQPQSGQLAITCGQANVAITVDRQPAFACPGEITLPLGEHLVQAQTSGFQTLEFAVTLTAEKHALAVPALTPVSVAAPVPEATPSKLASTLGWISVITGGVLVGGGLTLHLWSESERDEIRGLAGPVVTSMSQSAAMEQLATADTVDTVGAVLLGVGGAALATGVVLIVVDALGDDGSESVVLVPTGRGFAVACRF